jgi:hypothetical protein
MRHSTMIEKPRKSNERHAIPITTSQGATPSDHRANLTMDTLSRLAVRNGSVCSREYRASAQSSKVYKICDMATMPMAAAVNGQNKVDTN